MAAVFIKFFLGLLYQFYALIVSLKIKVAKWLSVIFAAQSSHKSNLVYHLVFSGSISLYQLRSQFQLHVLDFKDQWSKKPYNHLRYTWWSLMGLTFWKLESNFDLSNHIKHYNVDGLELPSLFGVEDVVEISGRLAVMSFSEGTSPWELLLLENVITSEGTLASVVILRIHHVLTECQSTIDLIHRLIGISAPIPLAKIPQRLLTEQYIKTSAIAVKAPCDLKQLTIDSKKGFDACTRTAHVTLCNEQIPWARVKKLAKLGGFDCNVAVYYCTTRAVGTLMRDFQTKLENTVHRTPTQRMPHRPDERCNDCLPQNSIHQPSIGLGATLLRFVGWGKPTSAFNVLLHLPEENSKGQISFDLQGSITFDPVERRTAQGLGELVDIIPSCEVGQIGSLAVVVTTAGKLRIVLTVDKRIFNGSTATFTEYVNLGLHELLAKGY